jgi:hypothetical protein
MNINYLQPLRLPEGVSIEENYDDLRAQEDHQVASDIKNPDFPQWLVNRGFKQDNLYFPEKKNSRILLPCDAHHLIY